MCKFASIVLTRDSEHWIAGVDSHEQIIDQRGLHADGARGPNILRIEITPPEDRPTAPISEWDYRVDQDIRPRWHDAERDEVRARAALARRAETERWLVTEAGHVVSAGYGSTVTGGYGSTVTGGDYAKVTGGDYATVTGGDRATVTGGDYAKVTGGDRATVTGGDCAALVIRWWDVSRYRLAVGYVGENGIEPGVAYRVEGGKLVRAT